MFSFISCPFGFCFFCLLAGLLSLLPINRRSQGCGAAPASSGTACYQASAKEGRCVDIGSTKEVHATATKD